MAARTQSGKKHFMKSVHDELARFEHKEIEFQKTERNQRAARLRLPIGKHYPPLSKSATDGCRHVPILKGFVICVSNVHVFITPCLGVENLLPDSSVHLAIK
jgi:hypothetical protein